VSEPGDTDPTRWADPAATYDQVASAYADSFVHELDHKPFDRELLNRFAATVRPTTATNAPVCDLGCGPGHIGAFVADLGIDVLGIDLSAGMVAQARRRYPDLTFARGDMTSLDLADQSLGGITCFYALIHIPRITVPLALREMFRVLAPGGPLLLSVHGGQGTRHADEMVGQPADLDATLFSLPELCELVEQSGLCVVEAHQRAPYEVEHPTPRLYVWAERPA
jgi:ubiquinone/menaquinone biosynthesis C-methylase UbiE